MEETDGVPDSPTCPDPTSFQAAFWKMNQQRHDLVLAVSLQVSVIV